MSSIEVQVKRKDGTSVLKTEDKVQGSGSGIGPAVAAARELQGLTVDQLSECSGIPATTISKIESGEEGISTDQLLALAKGLQMKMDVSFDMKSDAGITVTFKK